MHRFWDTIIEPVLRLIRPQSIVEIGSDRGHNTAKLLAFCQRYGARLHAIDPLPKFDVAAWQEQHGERFVFHQGLSLNVLSTIDRFDVVLIDGDHNWYTVFHELKLIEKRCADLSLPFPLVMLHDVGWPYGRRDLYYNPENIPDAYRKPYRQKGMRPGVTELQEKGGLNDNLYNSIYEHNVQNGVLTAIEDFLKRTDERLMLLKVPGFHGLGILVPLLLKEQHEKLAELLKALDLSPVARQHLERVEEARVELEILRLDQDTALRRLEARREGEVARLQEELQARTTALHATEAAVAELRQRLAAGEVELSQFRQAVKDAQQQRESEVARLRQQLTERERALADKDRQLAVRNEEQQRWEAEVSKLQQQLTVAEQTRAALQERLQGEHHQLKGEVARLRQQLTERERALADKDRQLAVRNEELKQHAQDIAQLERWIRMLDGGFQNVMNSQRWKLGHALGALYRKVRFKPPMPMPQDYWDDIMGRFVAWRTDFERRAKKAEEAGNGKLEGPASARGGSPVCSQEPKKKAVSYEVVNDGDSSPGLRIPNGVSQAMIRPVMAEDSSLPVSTKARLNKAVAEAEAAFRAEDWPEAIRRWQIVLNEFGKNETVAGRARLTISVTSRLLHIDSYKGQIANYIAARRIRKSRLEEDKKIVIYSAISGGYDSIKLPEKLDPRFRYVLFSDVPVADTGVWQVRPITYFHADATRTARFVKTHPHLVLEDCDVAIWIDANIMILGDIYALIEQFLASGKAIGAIPHPFRKSIYEELEACIQRKADDPETMEEQIAWYRRLGFDCHDLIESNLMMFNMRDDQVKPFLDAWWREIDRFSKRDQLSLNYALKQAGLSWHPIMKHPQSARNHPMFARVSHDAGDGPAQKLINALKVPVIDPYSGSSYADVREQRIAGQKHRQIDVVVCVHNALEDVKLCLESVRRARNSEHQRLIIVDDGSDESTAGYLRDFATNASWVELHRNPRPQGYTIAANRGLAASTGEFVILLNSDTIVTEGWAEKMADAVFSTPGAGIVGPMSNAASWQSIPEHRSSEDQTAINDLPPGLTAEDMNRYCEQWTTVNVLPRVPLVHGFCFGLTRAVINEIGLFDEHHFPKGYGEENDYCFRAADAGFSLVIATHTYIFHAKSKSYAGPERVALMKAGSEALQQLHGRARVERAVRSMQNNPILVNLRQRARTVTQSTSFPWPRATQNISGTTVSLYTNSAHKSIVSPLTAYRSSADGDTLITGASFRDYDFVDFGCSDGGSFRKAVQWFGGRRGIGLDINPKKVEKARNNGFHAAVCDIRQLIVKGPQVRFVIAAHFLEHLPGQQDVMQCLRIACRLAREFVYIEYPYFDADGFLFRHGLKAYWSDWRGHTCHLATLELFNILRTLKQETLLRRFAIYAARPIQSSEDNCIHALSSPIDQHEWRAGVHPPKPMIEFDQPVFRETKALIGLSDNQIFDSLEKCFHWTVKLYDSEQSNPGSAISRGIPRKITAT